MPPPDDSGNGVTQMLNANDRLIKLATASQSVLARIDAILCGEDTTSGKQDTDCRTITFSEAARRMGLSRPTVYRLAKAGRLHTVPLNGVSRILLSSVVECVSK